MRVTENYVLQKLENEFPIELELYDHGKFLSLDKIVVPGGQRGVGIGSEVLSKITDYADKEGKRIFLTPSTSYGGTSVNRLLNFYKRFGFKKVTDIADKAVSKDILVRHPHSTQ